jgi:S-disulfanyl-L-cysteine oxidoreductase SoxD
MGTLNDDQILAVLAFIKSTWPPGVRAYQAAQNPGGPSLADLPGDWSFPPSCGYHFGPESPS